MKKTMTDSLKIGLSYDDVTIQDTWSTIKTRDECHIATQFTTNHRIDVPIIASPMRTVCGPEMAIELARLGAVGILHRNVPIEIQKETFVKIRRMHPGLLACTSIGVQDSDIDKALELRPDVLMIDTAHASSDRTLKILKILKSDSTFKSDIIVGTVGHPIAIKILQDAGVDAIRVGIGGGSLCSTRVKTGVGIPNVTALMECVEEAWVPVHADGGIRSPGDVAKALSIGDRTNGVTCVVLGSLLAGTKESPGPIHRRGQWPNQWLVKEYYGEASAKAQENKDRPRIEGEYKEIMYKGKVKRIVNDICDGLRSSMSYVDAKTLNQFRENAKFIRNTHSSIKEGKPHLIY